MPFTQEATIKVHFLRLRKFVRLIDYLNTSSKLGLIKAEINTIRKTLGEFQNVISSTSKKSNWMTCQLEVSNYKLEFMPN